MHVPPWRIALTGVAIVILLALGIGFVAASTGGVLTPGPSAAPAASTGPNAGSGPNQPAVSGIRRWLANHAGRAGFARRLVHVTLTVTDANGNLVTVQIDHGTVQSVGNGSLTIAEAGGGTVTVTTDSNTKVWIGRTTAALADLKSGETVFVQSRVDGSTLAKRILIVPAGATAPATGG
ncbi:MAG TPA: DUF5666 domain-containing protein [Candidatus Limnocylindrales bacterium]|nr:DUF5666 domain-containing protein [Candidatus Limnocylindrales bacterium]